MNSKNIILLFLGSIFFLSVNAQLLTPATETYIDSLMRSNYTAIEPGAVLLIAEEGKPVYRKAFGLASVELAVPNREDYVFAIGSMTKQFTAIALLQLVGQGKVQLQDDIRLYLPDYNTHGETITLENLITHTSGIPSFTEMDTFNSLVNTDIGLKEMTGIFQDAPLLFTPGTDWSYSNSGFNLAGMIIEKVSGMTYGEYLQKHIFDPLRMESTSLGAKDKIIPRFVNGYQAGATTYMPASEFSWTWPYAAGQIISNVDDLLKWDEALYTNTILDSALIHRAFTNYVLTTGEYANYGYGWAVDSYAGLTIIRHGGAISGFLSDAVRIPEKHLYIALLSNNTKQSPGEVTDAILNVLLQLNITGEAVSTDAAQLKKYTGVYEVHRSSGRLVSNYSDTPVYRYITVEGDALYMQRTGGAKQNSLTWATVNFIFQISSQEYALEMSCRIRLLRQQPSMMSSAITARKISKRKQRCRCLPQRQKLNFPKPCCKTTWAITTSAAASLSGFLLKITGCTGRQPGRPHFKCLRAPKLPSS